MSFCRPCCNSNWIHLFSFKVHDIEMGDFKEFLETSSIHGLYYISVNPKLIIKLIWILIVIAGFVGSGVIIYQSFQSWNESPVKTTVESIPIANLKFPKVTVCPPKNTFTNLNYDLMMTQNFTIDNETRNMLLLYALNLNLEYQYGDFMHNFRDGLKSCRIIMCNVGRSITNNN